MRLGAIIALLLLLGPATAVDCYEKNYQGREVLHPPTYIIFAEQAELSKQTAECYAENMQPHEAKYYYNRTGEFYAYAADMMVGGDMERKMLHYMSSGDAYKSANRPDDARASYAMALDTFDKHSDVIPLEHFKAAQVKTAELEQPFPSTLEEVEDSNAMPLLSYSIAAIVFLIIAATLGYALSRR